MELVFEPTRTAGIMRGDRITEKASGFSGICTGISIAEEGSQMVAIQPPVADGKLPDAIWFDENACLISSTDLRGEFSFAEEYKGFSFGATIRDAYTGLTGRLAEAVLYQNGCIKVMLVPRSQGGDNDPKPLWIGQHRVEVVTEGATLPTINASGGAPTRDKQIKCVAGTKKLL